MMRLDKMLSNLGYGSRKDVTMIIRKGRVKINDTIIKKDDFGFHNTSIRKENIKYIVIHFSGADADASSFIELYN